MQICWTFLCYWSGRDDNHTQKVWRALYKHKDSTLWIIYSAITSFVSERCKLFMNISGETLFYELWARWIFSADNHLQSSSHYQITINNWVVHFDGLEWLQREILRFGCQELRLRSILCILYMHNVKPVCPGYVCFLLSIQTDCLLTWTVTWISPLRSVLTTYLCK